MCRVIKGRGTNFRIACITAFTTEKREREKREVTEAAVAALLCKGGSKKSAH